MKVLFAKKYISFLLAIALFISLFAGTIQIPKAYAVDTENESVRGSGGGSSFSNAVNLTLGVSTSLTVSTSGEKRYFKFVAPSNGTYVVLSSNYSGDPYVWVYNSSQNLMGYSDDDGINLNFWYSNTLFANNTYYIEAGHNSTKTGSYNITILKLADIDSRFYTLQNIYSSKYLDVHGPNEQIYVHQWTTSTGEQQKWLLYKHKHTDNKEYYVIRSQYGDNKFVGVSNTSTGVNNIQLYSSIGENTLWSVYVTYDGKYVFEPKMGRCLALYAPDSSTGTEMQLGWIGASVNKDKWTPIQYNYTGLTFSAFDVGDSSEDESALFKQYMTNAGYTNIGTYNNAAKNITGEAIKSVGKYSDIIYINGHGGRFANMKIQNASGTVIGNLCADESNLTNGLVSITKIGATFKPGSTTKTDSYWNAKTKWGILAQCAQLDYLNSEAQSNSLGLKPAQMWARTMLGDGARVHGYLGYFNIAPGGSTHCDFLEDFLFDCYYDDTTLISTWASAHSKFIGSADWATMYHSAHTQDSLSYMSSNTSSNAAPIIYYMSRAGDYHNVPLTSTQINSSFYNGSLPSFVSSVSRSNAIYNSLTTQLGSITGSKLNITPNGKIEYLNENKREWNGVDVGYNITDEEAVSQAIQELTKLGLMPKDEYRASVSKIIRAEVSVTEDEIPEPEVVEYIISFYRVYNGVEFLSDEDDGIMVNINKNGLVALEYNWRELQPVTKTHGEASRLISSDEARAIIADQFDMFTSSNQYVVSHAYYQHEEDVRPVWIFATDNAYANAIIVDMTSGEIY